MTIPEFVENGKKLWDTWNIRAFIILSLSLQTFLTLVAPLRKRTSNEVIAFLIWSAYLLADWIAIFTVGRIAASEGESQLLGFWTPFLLLHLGGPDTITALNLEDNSLWIRHLLSLPLQVSITCYILIRTFSPGSELTGPAILIFISGIVRYFERTRALNLASIGQYRNSIFKDSSKSPSPDPNESTYDFGEGDNLGDCEVAVKHAYNLYKMSRGVIVDLVLRLDEHEKIRKFFQRIRQPEHALKLLSIELNFFYDAVYTKAIVMRTVLGLVSRCLVYVNVPVAFVLFVRLNNDTYHKFDVKLTYALLLGAIALDGIALLMILFSDWSVPSTFVTKFKNACFLTGILKYFTWKRSTPKWVSAYCEAEFSLKKYQISSTPLFFRRWSESISSYSLCFSALPKKGLLDRCLPHSVVIRLLWLYRFTFVIIEICFVLTGVKFLFNYVVDKLGVREEFDASKHIYSNPISKELWEFIFMELQEKSKALPDLAAAHRGQTPSEALKVQAEAQRIIGSRGDWVLQTEEFKKDTEEILPYITGSEYDEVLLKWNIATELCFYEEANEDDNDNENGARYFSKTLSDYMLYLLIMQPSMMSAVAGEAPLRYRDTCKDTSTEIMDKGHHTTYNKTRRVLSAYTSIYRNMPDIVIWSVERGIRKSVCRGILDDPPKTNAGSDPESNSQAGKGSKSVLLEACALAKKLRSFGVEKKWRIMSKVWVEMLSYAASRCKGEAHAEALSRGGELITFVWLLMIHLGISRVAL